MTTKRTEEQTEPAKPSAESAGHPAFLVAYPESTRLPVPPLGEPFGHQWLAEGGRTDLKASRKHCILTRSGSALYVEDLGSTNGTFVNGNEISERGRSPIKEGDMLRIGNTLMVYREHFKGDDTPSKPLGGSIGPYGLREVADQLDAIKERTIPPINVLIHGETGTGKEALAQEVAKRLGCRSCETFNITGGPNSLFDAALFGHAKGAFTGAEESKKGLFACNAGGAVFLDEIGDLPLELQPKLLRFLQDREVPVVGGAKTTVDVVVIAATHKLEGLRKDILPRFNRRLHLPPLRERREDIFKIAEALLRKRGEQFDPARVESTAVERLLMHDWATNVRELESVLERIAEVARPDGPSRALPDWAVKQVLAAKLDKRVGPAPHARRFSDEELLRVVEESPNQTVAAERMGLKDRVAVARRLAKIKKATPSK